MNRLTINLFNVPSYDLDRVSSIALILPSDVRSLTAARLSTAINGRLELTTGGPSHTIIVKVDGFDETKVHEPIDWTAED